MQLKIQPLPSVCSYIGATLSTHMDVDLSTLHIQAMAMV